MFSHNILKRLQFLRNHIDIF